MTRRAELGSLYLVATPREGMRESEFLERVRAALDGGVDVLQLRCKEWDALPYVRLAERVGQVARDAAVPFFVNDRVDVALASGADGVHLGQQDLPVAWARRMAPSLMLGRSSHEPAHAEQAMAEQASYFAVGPVWATPTKPGRRAAGLSYVRDIASRATDRPWFAIGGITLENVHDVLEAGATRIALVRAVLDARDPAEAARGFVEVLAHAPHVAVKEGACT